MPTVTLAPALARWLAVAPGVAVGDRSFSLSGTTVRELLDQLFDRHPHLRGYVLDERGTLRHHVVAFVNGTAVADKQALNDPVPPGGELYLFQALSGG
jgi:hypothetical protein